ncbi:MAG: hypothetical protein ABR566_02130 [Pyrinomonadaceae bacterium]
MKNIFPHQINHDGFIAALNQKPPKIRRGLNRFDARAQNPRRVFDNRKAAFNFEREQIKLVRFPMSEIKPDQSRAAGQIKTILAPEKLAQEFVL